MWGEGAAADVVTEFAIHPGALHDAVLARIDPRAASNHRADYGAGLETPAEIESPVSRDLRAAVRGGSTEVVALLEPAERSSGSRSRACGPITIPSWSLAQR